MAPKQTHIRVGGEWKLVNNVWTRVNGSWVGETIPKVRVSGEFKECIEYGFPSLYTYTGFGDWGAPFSLYDIGKDTIIQNAASPAHGGYTKKALKIGDTIFCDRQSVDGLGNYSFSILKYNTSNFSTQFGQSVELATQGSISDMVYYAATDELFIAGNFDGTLKIKVLSGSILQPLREKTVTEYTSGLTITISGGLDPALFMAGNISNWVRKLNLDTFAQISQLNGTYYPCIASISQHVWVAGYGTLRQATGSMSTSIPDGNTQQLTSSGNYMYIATDEYLMRVHVTNVSDRTTVHSLNTPYFSLTNEYIFAVIRNSYFDQKLRIIDHTDLETVLLERDHGGSPPAFILI